MCAPATANLMEGIDESWQFVCYLIPAGRKMILNPASKQFLGAGRYSYHKTAVWKDAIETNRPFGAAPLYSASFNRIIPSRSEDSILAMTMIKSWAQLRRI